ncbi:hypothetical protein JYT72_02150 [Crocinitomix catalasitica]|nr:hypothetical protein [Crocinitomix catalasitica]
MKYLLSIILILGLNTAFSQPDLPRVKESVHQYTPLAISPPKMTNAWYEIVGTDTLCGIIAPTDSLYKYYDGWTYGDMLRYVLGEGMTADDVGLELYVDTEQELIIKKEPIWAEYLFPAYAEDEIEPFINNKIPTWVKAYPVFLTNRTDTNSISIEIQDGSLMMVCEAQDEKGAWKPIEYWSNSWCGNSYFSYRIPPQHLTYSKVMVFEGDFKTKCRLKLNTGFGAIYSNEFSMSINKGQFERRTD